MTKTQHFGRMVRERREALGLSIEKAAELCGMSYRRLKEIKLGDPDAKLSSILNILQALDINLEGLNSCMFLSSNRSKKEYSISRGINASPVATSMVRSTLKRS